MEREEEREGLAYGVSISSDASCFQWEEKMSLSQSTLGSPGLHYAVLRGFTFSLSFLPHLPAPGPLLRSGTECQSLLTFLFQIRLRPMKDQLCSQAKSPKAENCPLVSPGRAITNTWQGGRAKCCLAPHFRTGVSSPHALEPDNTHEAECWNSPPPSSHFLILQGPRAAFSSYWCLHCYNSFWSRQGRSYGYSRENSLLGAPFVPSIQHSHAGVPPTPPPPTVLIFRTYDKEFLRNTGQPYSCMPCRRKARPSPYRGKWLWKATWVAGWCWEPSLSFLLWLSFLATGSWPHLSLKAII